MPSVLTAPAANPGSIEPWQQPQLSPETDSQQDDELLHELFERQVDARPLANAVVNGTRCMSYGALERYANRIARRLRALGVGRGGRVGLLVSRTDDAYGAMLGILKAGAAYVPLDPKWPAERSESVLADAKVDLLVANYRHAESLTGYAGASLRLDDDIESDAILAESPARLTRGATGATSRDLCYIIYTSDSDGLPRRVMVEHRSARHLVLEEQRVFGVMSHDRVLQGSSFAFDLSVEETWLAFCAGAILVPTPAEIMNSGVRLARHLATAAITVLACLSTQLASIPSEMLGVRLLILRR